MKKILFYFMLACFVLFFLYVVLCYAITPEKDEEGNFYPISYILLGKSGE